MPKGYLMANIRVTDAEKFQQFSGMAGPVIQQFGGRILAKGPGADRHECAETDLMIIEGME